MKSFRTTALALIATGVLIAAPAISEAHNRTYQASLTAAAKNKNFYDGRVITVPRCLANRSVSVFSSAGVLQGSATSDAQGNWQVSSGPDIVPGAYYATVKPRRLLKNRRHRHICRDLRTDFTAT